MHEKTVVRLDLSTGQFIINVGAAIKEGDSKISCLFFGTLFEESTIQSCLLEFLSQFEKTPTIPFVTDWACGKQGAFALVLIDAVRGQFHCVTDRVNSHKIFVRRSGNQISISNSSLLGDCEPDLDGLGSYLSNSGTFGGKTIFKEVQLVPRASVFTIGAESESSNRYWDMKFDASYAHRKSSDLIPEFYGLIETACLRQTAGKGPLNLFISAGYDSSFLLGILAQKQKDRLTAISYSLKTDLEPGYDAYTARLMAAKVGVNFQLVKSYNGNLMETLLRAAKFTECLTFIHEPDAYANLANPEGVRYITGDECLGWGNFSVKTKEEAACANGFYNGAALGKYVSVFGPEMTARLISGCQQLQSRAIQSAPDFQDMHDLKDWLYLEQRENLFVLASRHYCFGQNWVAPLLDTQVLEFVAKLPSSRRIGKTLFKQTAIKYFPELYKFPRSHTGGGAANWKQELTTNRKIILDWIQNTQSSLDSIITLEGWEKLFGMLETPEPPRSFKQNIVRWIRGSQLGNCLLSAVPLLSSLGPRYLHNYKSASQIAPSMLLMKLLIARHLYIEAARSPVAG